jgi:uncharacterized membrane protein
MTQDAKSAETKKKNLPVGVTQLGFKEYKELQKRELEKRQAHKKTSKAADKVTSVILIILAIPLLALIVYFGIAMFSSTPKN